MSYRPGARNDLKEIFRFVLARCQDVATAQTFTQRIKDRCERIGDAPYSGRPRDDLLPGLRTAPFERSALIAYLVGDGRVRIVGVFYGGRDVEAFFRREDRTADEPFREH